MAYPFTNFQQVAMMGSLFWWFMAWSIVFYIYIAFALMSIAKRRKMENGWLAFIPIANFYLMTRIAKVSAWWMLALLLVVIPFVGGAALGVVMIFLWWKIAESLRHPGWWGLLMVIPLVNLVMAGIMAWGKK